MMKAPHLALLLMLTLAAPLAAKPAAWYLWQSKVDKRTLCVQFTPGDGWIRIGGPYHNAHCGR